MKNRLKEIRQEKNLSQTDIAKALGVTRQAISLYEKGDRELKLETWQKLADYFNVSVPYLQGLDQIWYQAECLECHKVFRISSQDADKVKCCPFCKKFYLFGMQSQGP